MTGYICSPAYPTPQHERAARIVVDYFTGREGVSAVLLTCSCARGRATPDSCLDMAVLTRPDLPSSDRSRLEGEWEAFAAAETAFQALRRVGAYAQVELDFHDGRFDPAHHPHGWTSGPDEFELEVGNLLAYSAPLWENGSLYRDLQAAWLPYYAEALRQERLEMVLGYCRNNLAHIPLYVRRGLVFQSFKRLCHAFEEFLQALFIARRTYPIAYDKWIQEQVVDILQLPDLYPRLVRLLQVEHLESDQLIDHAAALEDLIAEWII